MLEIVFRIVLAGSLMFGSAHWPIQAAFDTSAAASASASGPRTV